MHVPKIEKSTYLVIALLPLVYEFDVSDSKQEEGNFMLSCFPGVFLCAEPDYRARVDTGVFEMLLRGSVEISIYSL